MRYARGGHFCDLIIIKLGVRVGSAHEQPEEASELPARDILVKAPSPEGSEWRNASSSGNADDNAVGVLRQ